MKSRKSLNIQLKVINKLEEEIESYKRKTEEFYNEFDLASNCTKDDKLFKRLWRKYFENNQLNSAKLE